MNALRTRSVIAAATLCLLIAAFSAAQETSTAECAAIERKLPPAGLVPPTEKLTEWNLRIKQIAAVIEEQISDHALIADAGVALKACRYAILHREFYKPADFAKLDQVLELAETRVAEILAGNMSDFSPDSGLGLRGFRSQVDGSFQPLGIELPQGWRQAKEELPMYVWLHGRGEKNTDLHFITERLDRIGQVKRDDAIIIHPFGRQCVGYKSAGETDVMEAIEFACTEYPVDRQRIVLMGFSMGGAGVWHLAAHHTDTFVAASPGAGFAETAQYQNLQPENYPPEYEQLLWKVYDVPGYVRNLFNIPVVAYSGENDKQIQAATVMEEAYQSQGQVLPHLIGPGMGHKYHPSTLAEIVRRMEAAASAGQPQSPDRLHLQTQHLRYSSRRWIQVAGQIRQYKDTRVDAIHTPQDAASSWQLSTINVSRLALFASTDGPQPGESVAVDEKVFQMPDGQLLLETADGDWRATPSFSGLRKQRGLSGPIDDAFLDPFLVVVPSVKIENKNIQLWTQCELGNFADRWTALFRGDPRMKLDTEVTAKDIAKYHLICWGTPESNSVIGRAFQLGKQQDWPLRWNKATVQVGTTADRTSADAESHMLLGIYPNPLNQAKYLVLNSGVTFRQAHDRTNSLQNPHLPDWTVISLESPPTAETPGKVVKTGFFDEAWQFSPSLTW